MTLIQLKNNTLIKTNTEKSSASRFKLILSFNIRNI